MNKLDALRSITASLVDVKGRAALSHLPSHRIWVRRLHEVLSKCLPVLINVSTLLQEQLKEDKNIIPASLSSPELNEFRKIIPMIITHQSAMLGKLLDDIELLPKYKRGEGSPAKSFNDFSDLVTTVRQFVDNSIQIGFQLAILDSKEFNFLVLNSLHSFLHLAPDSLQVPFMTKELSDVLKSYDSLKWSERKNSSFSGTKYETFGTKVDYLVSALKPKFHKNVEESTKAIFKFSSEFAHVGYISTLITSTDKGGIYLGSEDDCFFASTENYVELQFVLLKNCVEIFGDLYLRAIRSVCERYIDEKSNSELYKLIDDQINELHKIWRATGWQRFSVFISASSMRDGKDISIGCICGKPWVWYKPHWTWDMYCPHCGTTQRAVPIWSDFGYMVTPQGPADVFGSPQPLIDNLEEVDRKHIYSVWEEFKVLPEVCKYKDRPEIPILFIRNVSGFKYAKPMQRNSELTTFICEEALIDGGGILIMCNCSYVTLLLPPLKLETMECWACGSTIRLLALSLSDKNEEDNFIIGYMPDGKPALYDIQGGYHKKVNELSPEEKKNILDNIKPIAVDSVPLATP